MKANTQTSLVEWLRNKAVRTDDIGDSTDFSHAAEVIEGLSEALFWIVGNSDLTSEINTRARRAITKARGDA